MKLNRQSVSKFAHARLTWQCVMILLAGLALIGAPKDIRAQEPAAPVADIAASANDALSRARKQIQEYFKTFSDLTCKEAVTQLVLNGSGRTIYRENSAYNYQFQTINQNGTFKFNESRQNHNPAFRDPGRTLMVTTGFASLLLVAHPMYEASYEFAPAETETFAGVAYTKVRFKPVPGASSPATLRLRGRNYPLPLSGALWIDPQSGAVVKIETTVDSSLSDLGLAGMHSEVHFALHQFREEGESAWVPESATIDVETPRQHWRNLHRFTDYKKFDVNVHEEIGPNP